MIRKLAFIILPLLLLLSLACTFPGMARVDKTSTPDVASEPSSTDVSTGSDILTSVILAEDVQGDEKEPVNPTSTFNTSDTIHAVVRIQDAPENTHVSAGWFVVDVGSKAKPNSEIDSKDVTTSGTRNIDFTLAPDTSWPVGSYRVEISLNGEKIKTVEFQIK